MGALRTSGLLLVTGCSFDRSGAAPDGEVPDAPPDVTVSVECEMWLPKPTHFDPCTIDPPFEQGLHINVAGRWVLNTTDETLTPPIGAPISLSDFASPVVQGDGTPALIVSVRGFSVDAGSSLRVIGNKALIVASWTDVTINGGVDVGSHTSFVINAGDIAIATELDPGAGAQPAACALPGAAADAVATGGSGGGGGGGFRGAGGTGGNGDTDTMGANGQAGGTGGAAVIDVPTTVRGGCNGGASGAAGPSGMVATPSNATTTTPAGAGGGAIQLTARTMITLAGGAASISAGGGGGGPAQKHSANGGGGAGSGGLVELEAPSIMFYGGNLAANGGGGGTSNRFADPAGGVAGEDGRRDNVAAAGAVPNAASLGCAVPAYPGSAGATLVGGSMPAGTAASCGGGGGGGGAGWIILRTADLTLTNTVISPPQTVVP